MPLLPESLIDEVQARTDIVEVIGRYVPLKRAGRHFTACCPFHQEKTPSFAVNAEKQVYHCFGCGAGGNVFTFLMQQERLTFPEAVGHLAEQTGIEIPRQAPDAQHDLRERLADLMEKACRYFELTLAAPEPGHQARAYIAQRGVRDDTARAFRLGAAPASWNGLLTAAQAKGVSLSDLEAAGLVARGRSGPYDRFRNRVIFPIRDVRGRVIGFGGRSLDGQEPKYLNSPETALYSKGRHLFGLAQAKDAIARQKTAVLVEGYFDCIVLADAGVANVVSPLGTALTVEQVRLLKRYAERAVLAFDPDAAGEEATLRGINLLVEEGLRVTVARLPEGLDPDECVRRFGSAHMEQLFEQSPNLFDVLVEIAQRRHPIQRTESRVRAAQFVLPTIAKVPDAILRSEYVKLLAQRLRLEEPAVTEELAKLQERREGQRAIRRPQLARALEAASATPRSAAGATERLLAALVIDEPARWRQAQERLPLREIANEEARQVLTAIGQLAAADAAAPTTAQVVSRLSQEGLQAILGDLMRLAQEVSDKEAAFADCLRRLSEGVGRRQRDAVRRLIQAAQERGDQDEAQRLLTEYQQLLTTGMKPALKGGVNLVNLEEARRGG